MQGVSHKDCGFKACIACVFWLILLTLVSDTTPAKHLSRSSTSLWERFFKAPLNVDQGPFVSITELRFRKGDPIVNTSGELFLMLDNTHIAYIKKGYLWTYKTTLIVEEKPFESTSRLFKMKFRPIQVPDSYVMGRAVALARRLAGRELPYWYAHCNEWHYMGYILLGEIPECPTEKCPLMRPIDNLYPYQIESRPFALKNYKGEDVITFP